MTAAPVPPAAKCECGHQARVHMNGKTCLGAYRNPKTGKEADATICPCLLFVPKETS